MVNNKDSKETRTKKVDTYKTLVKCLTVEYDLRQFFCESKLET